MNLNYNPWKITFSSSSYVCLSVCLSLPPSLCVCLSLSLVSSSSSLSLSLCGPPSPPLSPSLLLPTPQLSQPSKPRGIHKRATRKHYHCFSTCISRSPTRVKRIAESRRSPSNGSSSGARSSVFYALYYHSRELPQVRFLSRQKYAYRIIMFAKLCLSRQKFCFDKNMFVTTSILLSRQKTCFVTTSILLSRQKACFVATNTCLLQQK